MAGIILSSAGSQIIAETFNVDESKQVFGYEITYKGEEKPENSAAKYQVFDLNGTILKTTTKLNAKGMEAVREPGIYHSLAGDIYFAPAHNHTIDNAKQVIIDKKKIVMEDNLTFKFNGVSMESMPGMEENMLVKAMVDVTDGTQTENVVLVLAYDKDFKSIPVNILGNKYQLALTGVSNDENKIRIEVTNNEEKQSQHEIEVEVSTKPFVWLVWLGTILITISCLGAAILRFLHRS
jgi:cytochrome c-type biogenesis protein CcmF